MAIETDPDHGGAGASFTSAILVIEGAFKLPLAPAWTATRCGPTASTQLEIELGRGADYAVRWSCRARQGRSVRVRHVRRAQHARQHRPAQVRLARAEGQVPSPALLLQGAAL